MAGKPGGGGYHRSTHRRGRQMGERARATAGGMRDALQSVASALPSLTSLVESAYDAGYEDGVAAGFGECSELMREGGAEP